MTDHTYGYLPAVINNLTAMSERVWNVDKIWTVQEFCNRARHTVHRLARFIQTV